MTEEGQGSIPRSSLDAKDVFILDTGKELFVWVGNETSSAEQRNALSYAHVSFPLCSAALFFYIYAICFPYT